MVDPEKFCRHENLQTIMSNPRVDGERLYSIRCLDCGAMTGFYFTVGECLKRFKLEIFLSAKMEDR